MTTVVRYIEESYNELINKVTWSTWQQLQNSAVLVLVASVIFALLIFAMDYVFGINTKFVNGTEQSSLWKGLLGFYYSIVGAH